MPARTLTTLARIYLLGMLLSILPGSWAQVQIMEMGGKVTYEGQSVTLTCRASGFNFRTFAMSWHWDSAESPRELVASISPQTGSDKEYSSRVKGRASISRNNEAQTVSLKLNQLRKEDSGKYYCAKISGITTGGDWGSVETWENFGPGTEVTVLPLEQTVLTESGGGLHQTGKTLNLKCQTSGFEFKTSKLGWYLWNLDHAPQWLISLDSSPTDAAEERITIYREDPSRQILLKIGNLTFRDSGQYFCVRRIGNGNDIDKLIFGRGTDVTVETGPQAQLSPRVFLVRDQDAVACLIRNFYPKELHVSLASPGTLISVQAPVVVPMANGAYSAVQIGRAGENDTVTCSVKHLGKEIVSYQSDPGITAEKKQFCPEQDLMEVPQQWNELFLSVLGLRLLFIKSVAISVLFTTMAFIFSDLDLRERLRGRTRNLTSDF